MSPAGLMSMVETALDPLVAVRGLSVHFRLGLGRRAATVRAVHSVDFDIARQGPRSSYERCGSYVTERLENVYA